MATQSPFLFFQQLLESVTAKFDPPAWIVDEGQHRLVLLLNHVLAQEKAATARLVRQKGRVILVQWNRFTVLFIVTPAGLLDLAMTGAAPDLSLVVTDDSVASIAQAVLRGDKPTVRIEGDVQLAAEVNWLVDNVRWDLEEDLSRVIGDAPAHAVGEAARRMAQALRKFVKPRSGSADASGTQS